MHYFLHQLDQEFLKHANEEKAGQMEKYMRNLFPFYGISSPVRKEILQGLIKKNGLPPKADLEKMVAYCWEKPQREYQMVGMSLAGKYLKKLEEPDLGLFEWMIVKKSWWDAVDYIAATLVGAYFLRFPDHRDKTIDTWLAGDNLWLQRSTLIFQLKYKTRTDTERLKKNILALQPSQEFFINKAIGWALREYSKTDSDWVIHFVNTHPLSPLSKREALKWLDHKK